MKYYDPLSITLEKCLRAAVMGVQTAANLSSISFYVLGGWFITTTS